MVRRTQIVLEDDVDGGPAAETVKFTLDGVAYEIDLSEENAEQLRSALAPWIGHGRRTGGRKSGRGGRSARSQANDIRAWARDNGYQVSDRGRVPADIRAAYDRAH
ncbi:MAG: Lsr2 family protein [Actinomycetia bacterium]|nr:Lsr2 family protein [Actinomycetes bacterium]